MTALSVRSTTTGDPSPAPSATAGPPVLEGDARAWDVAAEAHPSEPGAHAFARDLALWLARLFDRPAQAVRVRTNPFEYRPCPRVWAYEITIAGHAVVVTAHEVPALGGTVRRHDITVDGAHVPFVVRRPAVHLIWQLACATWRATCHDRHTTSARATRA